MSKKHYIKIAKLLRGAAKYGIFEQGEHGAFVVAVNLAEILAEENPRFDTARFLEACNVNQES